MPAPCPRKASSGVSKFLATLQEENLGVTVTGKVLISLPVLQGQMSGQVSRGSAGEYQADEQAGVAGLYWRVSGR